MENKNDDHHSVQQFTIAAGGNEYVVSAAVDSSFRVIFQVKRDQSFAEIRPDRNGNLAVTKSNLPDEITAAIVEKIDTHFL